MKARRAFFLLLLLTSLTAFAAGYILYDALRAHALRMARQDGERMSVVVTNHVLTELNEHRRAVKLVAGLPEIRSALGPQGKHIILRVNTLLKKAQQDFGVDYCYLMNEEGVTVASSNWKQENSFVGKNYGFRPYFKEAIKGDPSFYAAVGVTTGKPGIYYSHPVYGEPEKGPIGVLVMKDSIEDLEKHLGLAREGIMAMVHPLGIIFVSNHPDWQYRVTDPLSEKEKGRLIETRQFGTGPWQPIDIQETENGMALNRKGESYDIHKTRIDILPGWQMVYFHNIDRVLSKLKAPLLKHVHTIMLLYALFITLSAFWLYRLKQSEIKRLQASENEVRVQKAYFENLINLRVSH